MRFSCQDARRRRTVAFIHGLRSLGNIGLDIKRMGKFNYTRRYRISNPAGFAAQIARSGLRGPEARVWNPEAPPCTLAPSHTGQDFAVSDKSASVHRREQNITKRLCSIPCGYYELFRYPICCRAHTRAAYCIFGIKSPYADMTHDISVSSQRL